MSELTMLGEFLRLLNTFGVVMLLSLILIGGHRKWWVFGHQYSAMEVDRDRWRDLALSGHLVTKRAVDVLAGTQGG